METQTQPSGTAPPPEAQTPPSETQAPAATQEAPYYASIWDPERPGYFKKKWQESLPPEYDPLKGYLASFDSLQGLAASGKDFMTKARTQGGVRPLTPESTPEDVQAYRKAFGIPDEPYQFEKPKELPEGLAWQEERIKAYGKWAQEKNWTPAQAKEALEKHMEFMAEDMAAATTAQQQAHEHMLTQEKERLRTTFGGALDGAVTRAQQVAVHPKVNLPPAIFDPASPRFAGVDMLQAFSNIASLFSEGKNGKLPDATTSQNTNSYRLATAMREKGHPDYEALKKGNKAALDKYTRLLKQAKEEGSIPREMLGGTLG